jgi:hypothetical protein
MASIPRLMPSEKRRKCRRNLKNWNLLILAAFSPEYIIMEITVLFLKLCRHQIWFDGGKYPFTSSASASPVNSICSYEISNYCRQIFKYNTVISQVLLIPLSSLPRSFTRETSGLIYTSNTVWYSWDRTALWHCIW